MIAEARSPPGRDIHFSHSALTLYLACPLRFHFKYNVGLPERIVSSSLVTGGAIHRALEAHFTALLIGHPPPRLDDLLDVFGDHWRDLDGIEVRHNKGEDINDVGKLAERVLRAFQASDLAHPNGTIIAIEESLRGQLIPGVPDLVARVDLIVENEAEVA